MRDYEIPGEARKPIGSLNLGNAKEALLLLSAAHTARWNAQTALFNLKMALAQRVIDLADHLEQQVYNTTDLPTKIDLTKQADIHHARAVAILYDLMREDDETLSSTKVNVN